MNSNSKITNSSTWRSYSIGLFLLGMACFVLTLFLGRLDEPVKHYKVPTELRVGPIHVNSYFQNYELVFTSKDVQNTDDWSTLRIDVLNKKEDFLFSLTDELSKAPYLDADGEHYLTEMNFSLNKGIYYLSFEAVYAKSVTQKLTLVTLRSKHGMYGIMKRVGWGILLVWFVVWMNYLDKGIQLNKAIKVFRKFRRDKKSRHKKSESAIEKENLKRVQKGIQKRKQQKEQDGMKKMQKKMMKQNQRQIRRSNRHKR